MKRDMDLIRYLLMEAEAGETPEAMARYTESQILYHRKLAIEAGLLEGIVRRGAQGQLAVATIQSLTWAGHDFLDVAKGSHWQRAKKRIARAGGAWTFDLLKSLLVEFAGRSLLL